MTELTVIQTEATESSSCACCAAPSAAEPKETSVSENAFTAVYTVSGMTCGHCVKSVTEEVGAISGVQTVDVELATGKVTVVSAAPLAVADIKAAVDEAGYELVG